MGPETITDVVYYDVQQWYTDINAVKLTRIVWTDMERYRDNRAPRGHDIAKSKSLAIFFNLLRTSFRHLHASDAEPQANCQAAEWRRLCRCQLCAGHWRLGASKQ